MISLKMYFYAVIILKNHKKRSFDVYEKRVFVYGSHMTYAFIIKDQRRVF